MSEHCGNNAGRLRARKNKPCLKTCRHFAWRRWICISAESVRVWNLARLAWGKGSGRRRTIPDDSSSFNNSATVLPGRGNVIRRDFAQRLQDEAAQVRARMRQNQVGRGHGLRAEGDQIQINHARFIGNSFGRASHLFFQGLQSGEQGLRRFGGARGQARHRVDEPRRAGRAVHRRRFPTARSGAAAESESDCRRPRARRTFSRESPRLEPSATKAIADCGLRIGDLHGRG